MDIRFRNSRLLERWEEFEVYQFMTDSCLPAVIEWILRYLGISVTEYLQAPVDQLLPVKFPADRPIPVVKVSEEQYRLYWSMKERINVGPPRYANDFGGAAEYLSQYYGNIITPLIKNGRDFPKDKRGGFLKARALESALLANRVAAVSISDPAWKTKDGHNRAHIFIAIGLAPPYFLFYDVSQLHSDQPKALLISDLIRLHYESDLGWGEDVLITEKKGNAILL